MLREVGRLTLDETKEIHLRVEKIFKQIEKGREDLAEKRIHELSNTANYFIREDTGKELSFYKGDDKKLDEICYNMLENEMYGIRAAALFYFYNKYQRDPHKILEILSRVLETVPWESESICYYMWKSHTSVMKEVMLTWQKSPSEKKRSLSIHGMENIASKDPKYVMDFLSNLLNDENEDVRKKVSHVLTQTCRLRSATCYPILKSWIEEGDDQVIKTVWATMKKLTNILGQKSKSNKSHEFLSSTQRIVKESRSDPNEYVSTMGNKLGHITKHKK